MFAQAVGGLAGVLLAALALGGLLADPAVNYAVTQPGAAGIAAAFGAELAISFLLMTVILVVSNAERLSRFTGFFAGALIAAYITVEAPLSGMSMNPARTLASAVGGGHVARAVALLHRRPRWACCWRRTAYRRLNGPRGVICAKLHHHGKGASAKRCIFRCGYAMLLLLALAFPAAAQVETVGMTVSDMDRSVAFYSRVLGFEAISDVEVAGAEYERLQGVFGLRMRIVRLRLGGETLELTEYLAPSTGRSDPGRTRGASDRWFQHVAIVVSDMDARLPACCALDHVRHASSGPQRLPDWNPNAGGIRPSTSRTPMATRWKSSAVSAGQGRSALADARAGRLFLGIDHTAIVVGGHRGQPRASIATRSGSSSRARARTTAASRSVSTMCSERVCASPPSRRPAGPGIELLEYLAPRDGRPMPVDVHANDLIHWQTRPLVVADADAAGRRARGRGGAWRVAGRGHAGPNRALRIPAGGCRVRDPDGHAMRLVQP